MIVLIWQLVRFWRGKVRNANRKLIALGLSAFLFPTVLQKLFIVPLFTLVNNLQNLFFIVYDNAGDDKTATKLIKPTAVSFSQVIGSIPVASVLEAGAVIVLLYHLIGKIENGKFDFSQFKPSGHNRHFQTNILLLNSLIMISLMFAIYFVLSVCITIPYLNEIKKPSGFTKRGLDSTINVINHTDTILQKQIPALAFKAGNYKDSLETEPNLKGKFSSLKPFQQSILIGMIGDFQTKTTVLIKSRDESVKRINGFYTDYQNSASKIKEYLGRTFQANSNNIAIDKGQLYRELTDALQDYLTQNRQSYFDAISDLQSLDGSNTNAFVLEGRFVKNIMTEMLSDTTFGKNGLNTAFIRFTYYYNSLVTSNITNIATPYERNGSDWGFLGWSAGYLIKTHSLDLVLLVGMIGFGILGASILSFAPVDDFFKSFGQHVLIKNFPNVLARGFGAALVVYLATKGGLALFGMGATQDPNGYILLLTCFIGAVYSQKVWDKVSTAWSGNNPNSKGGGVTPNPKNQNPTGGGGTNANSPNPPGGPSPNNPQQSSGQGNPTGTTDDPAKAPSKEQQTGQSQTETVK